MKWKGKRQQLLDAVTMVSSVVAPRSIKPILQNVRMVVGPEGATLLATDLEVAIRHGVPLEDVDEGGDVLLPAAKLLGILRESSGGEVVFGTEGSSVRIQCGRGTFKMLGEDPEEFPVVPSFDDRDGFTLQQEDFRTLIRKTIFATARERTRYAFNGVRLELEGDEVRTIATDGKRMAVKILPVENPDRLSLGRIIPTKGLQTFDRVLSDEEPRVQVSLQEKQAMIKSGRVEVSSRLVEGNFPHYQSVIPKETPMSARFKRTDLLAALRQAAILTNEESRSVRTEFKEGRLLLSSRAVDVGEAQVELECDYEGDPLGLAFNPDFLMDGIKAMDVETVTLRLSGRDTPALVEGEENFIYVVMPVTMRTG